MSKCNNCTKFLTCNRETCKQVTYLQAGQIEKIKEKRETETTEEATIKLATAFKNLGNTIAKEVFKHFNKIFEERNSKNEKS